MRSSLQVKRIGGALGACVSGLSLSDVTDAEIQALKHVLTEHLLVVVRRQSLSREQQLRLTRRFGPAPRPIPMPHLTADVEAHLSDERRGIIAKVTGLRLRWLASGTSLVADEVSFAHHSGNVLQRVQDVCLTGAADLRLDQPVLVAKDAGKPGPRHDVWHVDLSYIEDPPRVGFLYADELPDRGLGDTAFSNMITALSSLSASLQAAISGLRCIHSANAHLSAGRLDHYGRTTAVAPPPVTHPLIGIGADGRKHLFCNPYYVSAIESFEYDESAAILSLLYAKSVAVECVYRHQWQIGDLVLWDNRATMHYGVHDYDLTAKRVLVRTLAC